MTKIDPKTIRQIFRSVKRRWFPRAKVQLRFIREYYECIYEYKTPKQVAKQAGCVRAVMWDQGILEVYTPAMTFNQSRYKHLTKKAYWRGILIHEFCHYQARDYRSPHCRRFAEMYLGYLEKELNSEQIKETLANEMWHDSRGEFRWAHRVCRKLGLTE